MPCETRLVAFDLQTFEPRIRTLRSEWDALGLRWTVWPISPNHGKAVTRVEFDGVGWLASLIVWETGELELEAARVEDGWLIVKHYELDIDSLDVALTELTALVRDEARPPGAMISWSGAP